jgi:hypothetical protein
LRYGESDDGGRLEVAESLPCRRSNSATRAVSDSNWAAWASIWTACPAITSRSPVFVVRNRATSADSSATDDGDGSDTRP